MRVGDKEPQVAFYAVYYPRNFANEFRVYAFDRVASRNYFISLCISLCSPKRGWPITRAEAKHMLGRDYFSDPNTVDARQGINVFIKSANRSITQERLRECKENLDKLLSNKRRLGDWVDWLSKPVGL